MHPTPWILTGAAAAAIAFAAPADADPQSDYLDLLTSEGFRMQLISQPEAISYGNMACDDIRSGETSEEATTHVKSVLPAPASVFPRIATAAAQRLVDAAQQKLCPDTQGH